MFLQSGSACKASAVFTVRLEDVYLFEATGTLPHGQPLTLY